MTAYYEKNTIQTGWELVEDHIEEARLIAFDGCHKIYLALDDIEAAWFATNYDHVLRDTPEVMLKQLHKWYDESCSLKFINGVRHTTPDPNEGYTTLMPQGARDENDRCDECGYFDCDGHPDEDGPWECEHGHYACSEYERGPCSNEYDSE